MKKSKLVPIIAGCIIVIGLILTGVGYALGAHYTIYNTNDGLKVIDTTNIKTESNALDSFNQIEVDITDTDIQFVSSDSPKIEIRSLKDMRKEISYKVENNKLVIKNKKEPSVSFSLFNITLGAVPQSKITVFVPNNVTFKTIDIYNGFGDMQLADLKADLLNVKTRDGDLSFANVTSDTITLKNNFGDIEASNVKTNSLTTDMNDGDLEFHSVQVKTANMTNRFGDMDLSDFTSEGLTMKSNDGDIEIQGLLKGMTSITSHFGDVDVQATNPDANLGYSIKNSFGDIVVNNNKFESSAEHIVDNGKHKIMINAKDGDVNLQY